MTGSGGRATLSRRAFLGTAAVGAVAVGGAAAGGIAVATSGDEVASPAPRGFRGEHQAGVLEHPAPHGLLAAFTCVDPDRETLARTFRELSDELEALVSGRPRWNRGCRRPTTAC